MSMAMHTTAWAAKKKCQQWAIEAKHKDEDED
jgi:hypothetical protein